MDLIFNELSFLHKAENDHNARTMMETLLLTCKAANENGACDRLRMRPDFFEGELAVGYKVRNWLSDPSVPRKQKDLLLGLKRYPCINENDEEVEELFVENSYYLENLHDADLDGCEAEGLAVAFLYDTLAVSLDSHGCWRQILISLRETAAHGGQNTVQTKHLCISDHIEEHREWIASRQPVKLVESTLLPEEKKISLRDDHGKDLLLDFCRKLVRSPYVEEVVNSLPFNPYQRDAVRKIYANGQIEFVLTRTDQGLGCVLQTTGRNIYETRKIADLLSRKFEQPGQ